MFIRLTKINKRQGQDEYYLSEVTVNASQIVYMAENVSLAAILKENKMNLELNKSVSFTDLKLNLPNEGLGYITVVGDPKFIESKIFNKSTKRLLRD